MTAHCLKKIAVVISISLLAGCSQPLNVESVKGAWKPSTKAYTALGDMTISDDTIVWSNGQKASFRIIKQDKYDIIVELAETDLTKFNNITYKYLKFTPKDNIVDLAKEDLRISFYGTSQGLDDKNAPQAIYTRHYKQY